MKTYKFIVTLYDSGLPYPNREEAEKDANEWAGEMAAENNCEIADVQVDLEDDEDEIRQQMRDYMAFGYE